MRFKYELTGIGWADGCIEMNSNTVYFATSYITDALNDMLKALNALIPEVSSYPVSKAQFEWNEEPGGTVWTLSKVDDLLHLLNERSKVFSIISFSAGLISLIALVYNYIQFSLLQL